MTALQTPQEFVSAVRRGRLVEPARLKAFVAVLRGQAAFTARRIADRAVAAALLTRFQADEVLAGRGHQLVLADYRLLDRLGEGGAGGVFLAEHLPTGERRAVKVLHADHTADPTAAARLRREAAVAAGLCHPNVVRVFEYHPGCSDRPPFLAMEYVDGVSLQAAVALGGTLTAEAAAECGRQAALALQHAWDAGLVHRDVKPANLFVARDGLVKVLDFGLVRVSQDGSVTAVGGHRLLGTAAYIAPEQITDGSAVDCRADVYALGGALYFLLAGHPPFDDATWFDRARGKPARDPLPVHHLRPDVPEGLSALLAAMLAARPDRRPPTPADAARRLARWADPAFALDLFARLDRAVSDTPPDGTPFTPGPVPVPVPTRTPDPDEIEAKGSTAELPSVPPRPSPLDPHDTVRVEQPTIIRPPQLPTGRLWWLTVAATVGLTVVVLLMVLALTVVR
jgi:serine/threonine protein kinase